MDAAGFCRAQGGPPPPGACPDPRRWSSVVLVAALWVLGGISAAAAHLPAGEVLSAFQFPDHSEPRVDGDLRDWEVVGAGYLITGVQFRDLVDGAPADPEDFSVRLMVGWSEWYNRLYLAAEVVDDVHQIDRPAGSAAQFIWQDDDMEVFVDADHSGGQYADFTDLAPEEELALNGAEANHFILAGPSPDEDFLVNYSAASWYSRAMGTYTEAALTHSAVPGGPAVTRYEFSLVPFDRVNMKADFLSQVHDLREAQVIGLNVEFNDFDTHPDLFDAKWSLSGGQNAYRLSERFADFRLGPLEGQSEPTSAEARTWGQIKASFLP